MLALGIDILEPRTLTGPSLISNERVYIMAQLLEFAAWGSRFDYNSLGDLARSYYANDESNAGKSLIQIYEEVFNFESDMDREVIFNRHQKLVIVAEEVSLIVKRVSEYLRDTYNMNVNHLEYEVLRNKDGEYLISVEKTLGFACKVSEY